MKNEAAQNIKAKRVLELNGDHHAYAALKEAFETDKEKAEKLSKILHSQGLLISGLPLENAAEYTELICLKIVIIGLK